MRALRCHAHGDPAAVVVETVPDPVPDRVKRSSTSWRRQ